jgi:hypothetical protein
LGRLSRLLSPRARLVWLGAILVYLGVRCGQGAGWVDGPVAWYLPDLACMPIVLGLVLMGHRLAGRPAGWRLPWWHGALGTALYALHFEVLAPRLLGRGTGDPLDVLAYVAGWGVFAWGVNR